MATLYVADMNRKRVHAVDYESGDILRARELEQDPWGVAVAQNGEHLAVALDTVGTLVLNPETFEIQCNMMIARRSYFTSSRFA